MPLALYCDKKGILGDKKLSAIDKDLGYYNISIPNDVRMAEGGDTTQRKSHHDKRNLSWQLVPFDYPAILRP